SLISMEAGIATAFSINKLQDRGRFFISPGAEIYKGQVIGENTRNDDLSINVIKGKKLTNMRTQSTDAAVQIEPKIDFSLEESMEFIQIGIALYCLEIYKGKNVGLETIFSRFNGFKPIIFMLIYTLIVFLGLILLVVPGIILGLMYSQVFFILADDPDIGVIEAFNLSSKMMKNNMWQFFMLNLEALLYFIAGVFTLLIWWIWLLPRYSIAYAGFYEELKK
ncbi:DUF975 family protein, partial [Flavobacteriaceae bacterium]|nr:DUF975 family protein [Flavobacteriaceae bacterium]